MSNLYAIFTLIFYISVEVMRGFCILVKISRACDSAETVSASHTGPGDSKPAAT